MLEEVKLNELNHFVERLSREELLWLNGYVSGLVRSSLGKENAAPATSGKITITYGTETGNSKKLATEFATKARKQGLVVKLASLDQYRTSDLLKEENLITVISTHGEGEPPEAARKFFNYLNSTKPALPNLQFSVLALGDTAYPQFCKAGEELDSTFELLGAKRISPLQKCDVDFETAAETWFEQISKVVAGNKSVAARTVKPTTPASKKIYTGRILSKVNLNGRGSSKETYHLEIASDDLVYKPGDSIGIVPQNRIDEVKRVIQLLGINSKLVIEHKGESLDAADLLTRKLNISYLPERIVEKYAAAVQQNIPAVRIDLVDLLRIYPPTKEVRPESIIQLLDTITPRLYSISSSLLAHDGEAHITVARNCFKMEGETRHGLCSDYLSKLEVNSTVDFYVHKNSLFRLPSPDKDIIMIGPGTGIAPFRAFVEERVNRGATGRSWLFFGDQHFESDFLYQTEWQDYLKTGALTKMNVAFSRDQDEKIYVQHKLLIHSTEVLEWIENGAYLYVCGAKSMSIDVENILLEIISVEKQLNEEQATNYLSQLAEEGRYLKDVY